MIYLDNAATERASEYAAATAYKFAREVYYNPGGRGKACASVMRDIDYARKSIGGVLSAGCGEIFFMSSATEANNLVLRSGIKRRGQKLIISAGEHASVFNTAKTLSDKYEIVVIPLLNDGRVNAQMLLDAVDDNAAMVSLIHAGNETGAINDINMIAAAVKKKNKDCLFHSDGVQAFCKIPYMLTGDIDFYTVSAHKIGGFKGTAALYIKTGINLNPIITGGKQEKGLRAGTENVPGIMAFGAAAEERSKSMIQSFSSASLSNMTITEAFTGLPDVLVNSGEPGASFSPYIISASFKGIKAEVLAALCEENGVLIGLGSACSASYSDNRVLSAMGVPKEYIEGSIRISLCPDTTGADIRKAAEVIGAAVSDLRAGNV